MFKYFSKWSQNIIQTPNPEVEEAKQEVEEALEVLNKKLDHLLSIEGVSVKISYNKYGNRKRMYFFDEGKDFRIDSVSETYRREV